MTNKKQVNIEKENANSEKSEMQKLNAKNMKQANVERKVSKDHMSSMNFVLY